MKATWMKWVSELSLAELADMNEHVARALGRPMKPKGNRVIPTNLEELEKLPTMVAALAAYQSKLNVGDTKFVRMFPLLMSTGSWSLRLKTNKIPAIACPQWYWRVKSIIDHLDAHSPGWRD